jgi:hypothetical protein
MMGAYGSSLATVVAIVVTVAAAAGFVAAYALVWASVRRRRRLLVAVRQAAALGKVLRRERMDEGARQGVRSGLTALRQADESGQLRALDELEVLPAELLAWAQTNGPAPLRAELHQALDLLEVDRDVRRTLALGGGDALVDGERPTSER